MFNFSIFQSLKIGVSYNCETETETEPLCTYNMHVYYILNLKSFGFLMLSVNGFSFFNHPKTWVGKGAALDVLLECILEQEFLICVISG